MIRNGLLVNRRGDVPVTILVIGVFGICALALLTFMNSTIQLNKSFVGIELVEKANFEIEKYSLDDYYDEKTKTVFISFDDGLKFFEEKVIFSVRYFGD